MNISVCLNGNIVLIFIFDLGINHGMVFIYKIFPSLMQYTSKSLKPYTLQQSRPIRFPCTLQLKCILKATSEIFHLTGHLRFLIPLEVSEIFSRFVLCVGKFCFSKSSLWRHPLSKLGYPQNEIKWVVSVAEWLSVSFVIKSISSFKQMLPSIL